MMGSEPFRILPHSGRRREELRRACAVVAALALLCAPVAQAERTRLKPGWNLFSPQEDIALGQKVSQDAERQLPMLNDSRVDNYLNRLGRRLADKAPGEKFPYQFKAVNDRTINAFALPGGFLYVHRGVIEVAENEAQLAGVMAHEIGHVALRHGTNQATKAYAWQLGLGAFGAVVGGGLTGVMAQLGAGFAANSLLLKYSRDAERQADLIGTQILYDNSYDPRAMAQFFEKIQAESKGGRMPDFFSSHPNPENRMENVNQEIGKLGGPPQGYRSDSAEFREIQRYVRALPPPARGVPGTRTSQGSAGRRPPEPAERTASFENRFLRMAHPENWQAHTQGDAVMFVPEGGVVDDGRGIPSLAYGMIVNVFEPHSDRYGQITLEEATDQLVDDMRQSNPRMRVTRGHERMRLGGLRALSTFLSNDSALGGRETIWLVTVIRPEGVLHFVCVAPERDYDDYEAAFQTMVDSVRFSQR